MVSTHPVAFLKGHGTENDFVILPDPAGELRLSTETVARLCDRRAGVGGDGLLRVVRSAAHPEAREMASEAEWFMDYRNGDGSLAEMCGNGLRVFAYHLVRSGLVPAGDLAVATRAGVRHVRASASGGDAAGRAADGAVTVDMGRAKQLDGAVTVTVGDRSWPAYALDLGNPHAVVFVDELADAGALRTAPAVAPVTTFPDGVNVEFVVRRGERHIALRVHERGAGETRSCGTGACAAMVAAARRDGADPALDGSGVTYTVDVPGGRLVIAEEADGRIVMTGPAVIVAEGSLNAGQFGF
ncbi:diaminopimelate epimerase [Streptomyces oceani]|uniref:Diaminopimelate epimerase n=1 Tax=Streptomyces oceani TaxID=1075402 RepID=A0A1E7KL82_9ACTN|nr:diaminopimelate epimerase [Streptomyces oceani]OEV04656.1 diaminopimelate epimerase [Streptomyces oceani]